MQLSLQEVTDSVRQAIPEAVKKPLRLIRSAGRRLLAAPQWVYRDYVKPDLRILSLKARFCAAYCASGFKAKTVLTFPHKPEPDAVLYKICHCLGYRITDNVDRKADVIINWEDCTFRRFYEILEDLNVQQPVLNLRCTDISKKRVEEVHQAVFGYGLAVNPLEFNGPCVRKPNENATHDGRIIQCPVNAIDTSAVYQRIVNNTKDGEFIEDIRVPIFGDRIPFCYLKRRPVRHRFSNENTSASLVEREAVLSRNEAERLSRLCRVLGLDYGELDVLRDVGDGRLYVVDVNNTPWGPPNHLDSASVPVALERLAEAFAASFMASSRQ